MSVEKLLWQPSENLWHCWSKTLRKNVNKLIGATGYWLPISLLTFFLKVLDQWCQKCSEGYLSNFSTDLSSQILDCCPRNFVIQEERFGNVVNTSHWITPVYTHCRRHVTQQHYGRFDGMVQYNTYTAENNVLCWSEIVLHKFTKRPISRSCICIVGNLSLMSRQLFPWCTLCISFDIVWFICNQKISLR